MCLSDRTFPLLTSHLSLRGRARCDMDDVTQITERRDTPSPGRFDLGHPYPRDRTPVDMNLESHISRDTERATSALRNQPVEINIEL